MKSTRRILGAVLAVMMVLSAFVLPVSAVTFSDVEQNAAYQDAITTLHAFGIIKGYEDGTFKPNQNVTRAEFTAMLMRTLNMDAIGNKSSANLPFSDVSDQNSDISWAIHNIDTAYGMKIINGYEDGTFRPSDNVAYEEAVKMIVCALGYGSAISVDVEPWYANYLSQAAQLGITQSASTLGAAGTPATRACIAQLLYDSLDVYLVKNNELTQDTILSDYWKVVKNVGIIAANGVTSLDSPDINLRDDEIQIYAKEPDSNSYETHTYRTNDTTLKNYLGYQIEYYYVDSRSDVREVKVCIVKSNEPLVINAKNIEADTSTSTQIRYYKNMTDRNTTSIALDADNAVVYNGKLYGSNRASSAFDPSMLPEVGTVTLIDSNRDGKYEVIDILAYDVYYVSGRTSADYSISDNVLKAGSENRKLVLNPDDSSANLSLVNKSGSAVSFGSINVGNIICYAESNPSNGGTTYRKAIVLSDVVSGTVGGRRAGESITINGKEYEYSNAAPWIKYGSESPLAEPQMQDNYTFMLDLNGDVVAYNKSSSTVNEEDLYGYIMGYASTSGDVFNDEVEIRMLTAAGRTVDYPVVKGTRVDGNSCASPSAVISELEDTALNSNTDGNLDAGGIQQLVKYTTRTTREGTILDSIITAQATSDKKTVVSDELYRYSPVDAMDSARYSTTGKQLTADNGDKMSIANALIFVVPSDRSDYKSYKKGTLTSSFKDGRDYNVEVFDMASTNSPKVVVLYDGDATSGVDSASPVYVLTDRGDSINDYEGSSMTWLSGYESSISQPDGEFSNEWLSPDSISAASTMELGSIFRATTDSDNYLYIDKKEHILFEPGKTTKGFAKVEDSRTGDYYSADFTAVLGSVVAADDNVISVAPELLDEGDTWNGDVYTFNISDFSNARSLLYYNADRGFDPKNDLVDISGDHESSIQSLNTLDNGGKPSQVLIYMSNGRVKLFAITAE